MEENLEYERFWDVLKVGDVFTIKLDSLLECVAKPCVNKKDKDSWSKAKLTLRKISDRVSFENVKSVKNMPLFVRYIGNCMLEEMDTGKIILVGAKLGFANLPAMTYGDLVADLERIYNAPLIVNYGDIREFDEKYIDKYMENSMTQLLNAFEKAAKKNFHESLKQLPINWHEVDKESIRQKIKHFQKEPIGYVIK